MWLDQRKKIRDQENISAKYLFIIYIVTAKVRKKNGLSWLADYYVKVNLTPFFLFGTTSLILKHTLGVNRKVC